MTGLNTVMQRLIHGEVGSGKTAVAFYAAMLAALNGKRTLILAPTTILASQHWDTLRGMGWEDVVLQGRGGGDGKSNWYNEHIIIGTHAMLNNENLIRSASLVIIDEFSKFGVLQRQQITKHNPHLLLMSATPLPRSLAMTVFGDLDISVIKQLPIRRGTVITKWILPD
jgi:ATP-dependent DNA helicase RecG